MTRPVWLGGRGLACGLGADLDAALAALADGGVAAQRLSAAPGYDWPYFAIPAAAPDADVAATPSASAGSTARPTAAAADAAAMTGAAWEARARALVRRCVDACGAGVDRGAPLYIASSSLNVGALEAGADELPDCQAWVERVAAWLDWRGEVIWIATACTSAFNALLSAQRRIAGGGIDSALVLGLELRNRFSVAGFGGLQLLDAASARPLAADRGGLVLGEAVAALQLTATPQRWRLAGGANLVDGSDPAGASPATVAACVEQTLAAAGLAPQAVDLIKLQAAGSPHNDAAEIAGLRRVFAPLPALTTLKPWLGHTLGAAGAAELALLTAACERGVWPPTAAAAAPDPALEATLAPAAPARLRHVLALILGFGGGHAALALADEGAAGERP